MIPTETKQCLSCNKPLKGRSDKKFCDDYCRNNYNNVQKSKSNFSPYVRNIMNALLKNRKLLEQLLPSSKNTTNITKEKLQTLGFNFQYHTHTYTTKTGDIYFFSFDYGYKLLENNWCMVVKRREE
jgi:hypothetical protein